MSSEEKSKKGSRLVSRDEEKLPLSLKKQVVEDSIQAEFLKFEINTVFIQNFRRS